MYEHFDTIQDISLPRVSVECFVSSDLGIGVVVLYIVIVYDDREGAAHDFIIDDRDDLSFGKYANEFVDLFGSPKYVATVGIDTGERVSQLVVIFCFDFLYAGYFISSLIKYVLPFWVIPLPSFNESFCRLVSSLLCRRYSILR